MMENDTPKYPDIHVRLSGENGNTFSLVSIMLREMKQCRVPQSDRDRFQEEALSGDYSNVLSTCMKWVHVS